MSRSPRRSVFEALLSCAMCVSLCSLAHADAGESQRFTAEGLGSGGAYFFGLLGGLALFGLGLAIDQRKAHLSEFGKR